MLREIRDLCLDVCQRAVAVSPDGSFAVGGSAAVPFDENLSVWDVASGKLSKRLGKYGPVRSVALSADGHRLLVVAAATGSGAESRCELWDTRRWTVEPVAEPDDGYGLLLSAAFAPDGSVLVGTLNNVYRCQIGPDRAAVPLLRPLLQGCFHMDSSGHRIATGHGGRDEPGAPYEDCCARVWDVDSRTQTAEMPTRFPVETIAISPDGEHVITGGEWGEVHLWSIRAARTRGWPWRPW